MSDEESKEDRTDELGNGQTAIKTKVLPFLTVQPGTEPPLTKEEAEKYLKHLAEVMIGRSKARICSKLESAP